MKLTKISTLAGATALALGLTTAVNAEGLYIGASVGQLDLDFCTAGLTSCDDEDTGWKLLAGYELNDNIAFEGGWVDLGKYSASGPGGTFAQESDGIFMNVKGTLPINESFGVFAKLGVLFWENDYSGSIATALGISDDDGTDAIFGLGAQYMFSEQVGVVAEWERYDSDDDADMLSIGGIIKF